MTKTWKIDERAAGQRLDVFLASKLPDTTRSAIAKQLKAGAGSINGKTVMVHTFLKNGHVVKFSSPFPAHDKKPTAGSTRTKKISGPISADLKKMIVAETPDWIVVNKPTGLLVHPDYKHPDGTLIDLLISHFSPVAKVGEDPSRPGIVHRLDKDVSGLMVIAKTQDAFDELKRQFAQRLTEKKYLALVYGTPPKEEGEIRFRIARSAQGGRMAARPEKEEEGKAAWTHYRVLKKQTRCTLLEVQIFSGRTHQIRAHLFALGCPVVGDTLYKIRNQKPIQGPKVLPGTDSAVEPKIEKARLMLQSVGLSFDDPTSGERKSFTLPPDPVFERFFV